MKILRIIARLNVGGPARHVVWLTKALDDADYSSVLIAGRVPEGEEDMAYFADEHGVEPVYIDDMSRELSPRDAISLWKVFREIRRHRPDIIHTHTAKAGTIGRAAALLHRLLGGRVQIVHTFHGHVFHSYYGRAKTAVFIAIEKLLARFATDKIIVITDQQFEEIHNTFGIGRSSQFAVIPLGIDLEPFAQLDEKRTAVRREMGIGEDDLLVGFVGRLTEIKDVSLYLKTASLAIKDPDAPPMRFVIAGDGHLRSRLEQEARELDLGDEVIFLGSYADAPAVYAALDVVALTSLNEGTPLSLIEAMAAGRPFISTVVGGVRDLLGETVEKRVGYRICERGVGVDSRSPSEFAKGLIYLAKNERLRKRLADAGRVFAASTYSKDRLVHDVKELYRSLKQATKVISS